MFKRLQVTCVQCLQYSGGCLCFYSHLETSRGAVSPLFLPSVPEHQGWVSREEVPFRPCLCLRLTRPEGVISTLLFGRGAEGKNNLRGRPALSPMCPGVPSIRWSPVQLRGAASAVLCLTKVFIKPKVLILLFKAPALPLSTPGHALWPLKAASAPVATVSLKCAQGLWPCSYTSSGTCLHFLPPSEKGLWGFLAIHAPTPTPCSSQSPQCAVAFPD